MKFNLLIAALFGVLGALVPHTYAQAVEPYEYANPSSMTTKALILDVAEIGDRLVAVGEFGHIIYSDDRGESWVQAQNVPTRNTITAITFLDDKTGYAVGHDATILKTEDGGESWSLKYVERRGENPLFGLQFSDATYGVAVGAFSTVMETKDGGETWAQRPLIKDGYDDFHLNGCSLMPPAIYTFRPNLAWSTSLEMAAVRLPAFKQPMKARSGVAWHWPIITC